MTKKRRNLRILASIIAAGCVWATGMNSVWAAGSSIVPAQAANYVAFGLTAAEKADLGENNLANTKEVKIGEVVYKYNLEKVTYQNANNETETTHYWVRDGYGITVNEGMFHEEASNNRHIDVYQTSDYAGSVPREQNIVFTGNSATQVTDVATAINKDNLYKLSYKQFTGLSNSNSTGVGEKSCFYIERDGKFVNVGGYNQDTGAASDSNNATFVRENFYAFNESTDYNSASGKYQFKGQDVEYDNVYSVTFTEVDPNDSTKNVSVTKNGVFLTQEKGSGSDPYANCEVYTGPVYGRNNEILVTAFDQTANTWSTVWGAGVTDPNATIGNMKLAHFNEILSEIHDEDVKLAMADVEKAKVTASGTGGSVDLINKKGNTVPGFRMNSAGGINEDTYVTVSDGELGNFRLKTGSVVRAVNPKTVDNDVYFNTLKINDVDYKIESVSGIELTQDDNGNLVVNLTTNAGNTINSNAINIGDFIIDYGNGIPGEQGPSGQTGEQGQPGQSGTGNQTTIEQAINNNYTNITNNTTEINEIKNDYVTNIRKNVNNEDIWYVTQNVDGKSETVEFKDKHITGHTMTLEGDSIKSTITNNFDNGYINTVRVGDATIRYDGDNNQAGNTQVTNSTIEEAINNNYKKIVNVENNNVTNISERKTEQVTNNYGKTYDVSYYEVTQKINGQDVPVKIQDTTLVPKAALSGARLIDVFKSDLGIQDDSDPTVQGMRDYISQNALVGRMDPVNGMPQIMMEFEDTSGNVVQGALDFGSMIAEATEIGSDDGNIVITNNNSALGYNLSLANDVRVKNSITVNNLVTINPDGRISGVADGEISANSTDAINGSQLWETNRNMDKLGGRLDKVGAGAAALAALHPLDFDPDDKLQFSAGVGNYKGETAAALGAFYRPTEKVMFSVAGTMGNGENMVNAGVTFALDRKNNVSNSRVAMAHEIKDLRDQVAALTALVSQIAGKGNPLLDTVMFPDVPENHWAYDYVEALQKRGIIEGYPDGNFGGDRSMTRYEYAAMLYRALEKGFPVDGRLLKEFEAELGRIRIDRIKGADDDSNKVERVRVNDYEDRDDYGSKLAQVVADAAPAIEEEPAA